MHVVIEAVGSAGDVHPFIGVGAALAARGHGVTLIANEVFRPAVERASLAFLASSDEEGYRRAVEDPDLWHPVRGSKRVLAWTMELLFPRTLELVLEQVRARPDDTVLVGSTLAFASRCAAEVTGAPFVGVTLAPSLFRSTHRAPRFLGMWAPEASPRWWKRLWFRLGDRIVDKVVCPPLNAARARHGLAPVRRVFQEWIHRGDVVLALFPEWFAPRQPDWPDVRFAGFPLFDEGTQRPADPALEAWLADGAAPIVFTHGSSNLHARRFFEVSVSAARALARRALLVTVEPRCVEGLTGPDVFHSTYVPFSRVVPRSAAFVTHGGIGSVAQGLAAGVPQVAVPMGFDQVDNGSRVEDLGAGACVPLSKWTLKRAVAVLGRVLSDPSVAASARAAAARIDTAGARDAAVEAVESAARMRSPVRPAQGSPMPEGARLRIPPPVHAVLLALLAWGAQALFGCPPLVPYPWRLAGVPVGAAGVFLIGWSLARFRGRGTTPLPFGRPSALVIEGPYRLTRNPMYVALAAVLLGLALFVGSVPFFLAPPAFVLIMNSVQIPHEERLLARLFGEEWEAYRRRVRRWL